MQPSPLSNASEAYVEFIRSLLPLYITVDSASGASLFSLPGEGGQRPCRDLARQMWEAATKYGGQGGIVQGRDLRFSPLELELFCEAAVIGSILPLSDYDYRVAQIRDAGPDSPPQQMNSIVNDFVSTDDCTHDLLERLQKQEANIRADDRTRQWLLIALLMSQCLMLTKPELFWTPMLGSGVAAVDSVNGQDVLFKLFGVLPKTPRAVAVVGFSPSTLATEELQQASGVDFMFDKDFVKQDGSNPSDVLAVSVPIAAVIVNAYMLQSHVQPGQPPFIPVYQQENVPVVGEANAISELGTIFPHPESYAAIYTSRWGFRYDGLASSYFVSQLQRWGRGKPSPSVKGVQVIDTQSRRFPSISQAINRYTQRCVAVIQHERGE